MWPPTQPLVGSHCLTEVNGGTLGSKDHLTTHIFVIMQSICTEFIDAFIHVLLKYCTSLVSNMLY